MTMSSSTTIDPAEVERFSKLAAEWWNPKGKFGVLHKFNPVRLSYIKEQACTHFQRDINSGKALEGLRVLDIGCGGGLLCEPLARLGATVTGIDPAEKNIKTATVHADEMGLDIAYISTTAEELADKENRYDIVLAMEVVEHVSDVNLFSKSCAKLTRPNGLLFVATINRTLKAWGLAIIGAEYVLGWLPRGTHQYEKLVKPSEIETAFKTSDIKTLDETGVVFNPLHNSWKRSTDMDVNYMMVGAKD
jgi:2-polyprenyl-6-hydroxyphenyl methylase/3-demethylubiquinone-9 3-methyltransferase